MNQIKLLEEQRKILQGELDSQKDQAERNRLGQFATPGELAKQIIEYAVFLRGRSTKIRFLDPAIGTGAFFSALLNYFLPSDIAKAEGYEIDSHYAEPSEKLWSGTKLIIHKSDFTCADPPKTNNFKFNLIVCNPPYVRHHHISSADKLRLRQLVDSSGVKNFNGLSGLYCYFFLISNA